MVSREEREKLAGDGHARGIGTVVGCGAALMLLAATAYFGVIKPAMVNEVEVARADLPAPAIALETDSLASNADRASD